LSFTLDDLIQTRITFIELIKKDLTDAEKSFLLSIKKCKPNWSLLKISNIEALPAIKWKLLNLSRMDKTKHISAISKLEKILSF
jgi:hypothetical protein